MLNIGRDVGSIVGELFDPEREGALSLQGVLSESFRRGMLDEMKRLEPSFVTNPRVYMNAVQEMRFLAWTDRGETPMIAELDGCYDGFYASLSEEAGFQQAERCLHLLRYWPGSSGIGLHRDESKYRNIVSIFVVEGDAPFYVANVRDMDRARVVDASPGSLVLLRAPRSDAEKSMRPFHAVGEVKQGRYVAAFCQREHKP